MFLVLALLVAGSVVYSVLAIVATARYRGVPRKEAAARQPVSVLKPLAGLDAGLEDNLRSFFAQDYPHFELLFAVREAGDPAAAVVRALQAEYPGVSSRLLVAGEPPYANAKVWKLQRLLEAAAHELIVMSDSDVRVRPDLLAEVNREFADPGVGLATCPFRTEGGGGLWPRLEAAGLNTTYWANALTARMLDGVKFAIGATIAVRRGVLEGVGGFGQLREYLAEDFMMGRLAAEAGYGVILAGAVVEHRLGDADARKSWRHRMRWSRSTRRSRPWGYAGQLFTMPLPLALALVAAAPAWWPLAAAAVAARAASAAAVARTLGARTPWLLLPLEDLLAFAAWIAGFFGSTVEWRGRIYEVLRDGRFRAVDPA